MNGSISKSPIRVSPLPVGERSPFFARRASGALLPEAKRAGACGGDSALPGV